MASGGGGGKLSPELESLAAYKEYSNREVQRVHRNLTGLSEDDLASLARPPRDQVQVMQAAVEVNLAFLDELARLVRDRPRPSELPASCTPSSASVQTLLQTFTREWSLEGAEERRGCFDFLLGALDRCFEGREDLANIHVLCPNAHLGRLAFEVQQRGFASEACEARSLLHYGSEIIRGCEEANQYRIQPFALGTCNRFKTDDHVRATPVPEVLATNLPPIRFGEFLGLYATAEAAGSFDAVLTAFALDASPNVVRFVRTVAHCTKPGALWANFGPLAYDGEADECYGSSLELSWEELKFVISNFFEIQEEATADAQNAGNGASMMQSRLSCVGFVATRNAAPSPGIGQ